MPWECRACGMRPLWGPFPRTAMRPYEDCWFLICWQRLFRPRYFEPIQQFWECPFCSDHSGVCMMSDVRLDGIAWSGCITWLSCSWPGVHVGDSYLADSSALVLSPVPRSEDAKWTLSTLHNLYVTGFISIFSILYKYNIYITDIILLFT